MRIVVQKFGGTSLATPRAREGAVARIAAAWARGQQVVVVVSAMGRPPDPYATDSLLKLIRKESQPKQKDLLLSCGEILSVAVMSDLLEQKGISTETFVLNQIGIVTDSNHGDAEILEIDTFPILRALQKNHVVVIPGFQGTSVEHQVTTLGRGGSDTTATAVGAALKAEIVEIYTDVEGVKSADPALVPEATTISNMTYEDVGEMAYLGAKVIHPKAVTFAQEAGIPVRVRSTFSENPGTLVAAGAVSVKRVVTAVTHIPNIAFASVRLPETGNLHQARVALFNRLADAGVSLDFITVDAKGVYFTISKTQISKTEEVLKSLGHLHTLESGYAKVSVVGAGMRGRPGVMARVTETLEQAGIPLYHSTDSHITIACLVKQSDMEGAVRALHTAFISPTPDE